MFKVFQMAKITKVKSMVWVSRNYFHSVHGCEFCGENAIDTLHNDDAENFPHMTVCHKCRIEGN